jgi:uncharacterized protein YndB with AHSA1/START domain
MTERSTEHATFVIERTYPVAPARVFAAWADPVQKARWFVGPDEWIKYTHETDFRVGGRERLSTGPAGGPAHKFDCCYQDIVPDQRIIYSYIMHLDDTPMSISLTTVEFKPDGAGTRLVFTEQGVFLDGTDWVESREQGSQGLLDKLGAALAAKANEQR